MSWGGEHLRAARQGKGYSVEDIAQRLKVPARYVTALESEDASALPEATFVRGYIRAYARIVGLDPEPMLAAFAPVEVKAPKPLLGIDGTVMPTAARRASRAGTRSGFRVRRHHWVAGAVLLVVAVLASNWLSRDADVPSPAPVAAPAPDTAPQENALTRDVALPGLPPPVETPPQAGAQSMPPESGAAAVPAAAAPVSAVAGASSASAPSAAPAAAATAAPPPAVKPTAQGLFLHFRTAAWVEVRDGANLVIHSSFATADSNLSLEGKAPLTITLGDASAADIWWNGERVPTDRYARSGVTRIVVGKTVAR